MLSLDSIRAALVYRSLNLNYCKRKPIRKNKTPSASKNKTIGRKTNLDFSTIEKNFFFFEQNVGKACYKSYFLSEAIWKLLISTEDSSDSSFPKFLGKKFKAICKIRSFWLLQKLIHYFNNKSSYKTVRTIYITTAKWQWHCTKNIFCALDHIYWRNYQWKASFLVQRRACLSNPFRTNIPIYFHSSW